MPSTAPPEVSPNTQGIAPMIDVPPIEICGHTYQPTRFSFKESMALGRLMTEILRVGVVQTLTVDLGDVKQWPVIMAFGFPHCEVPVRLFLSEFLHVPDTEFDNPSRFPPKSFVRIFKAIFEHPDVEEFFSEAAEQIPAMLGRLVQTISPKGSNSSTDATDGQTATA